MSSSCLLTLARRDFSSSTESCSDWICPESCSTRPLLSVTGACDLLLQLVDRSVHLVDAVGALLDKVAHGTHVHVDGLLHARDLVLQRLDLGLQLDDLFADRRMPDLPW